MKTIELNVERRSTVGKNEARRSRMAGRVPAIVYGAGKPTVPVSVDRKALSDAFRHGAGENAIFLLKLAGSGEERHAMIRDMQLHPLSREILHLDFLRVLMTEKVRVQVAVELTGTAYGVKTEGGVLDFSHRAVYVECLPGDIPKQIEVDVSELRVGQHLTAGDLALPAGVELLDEPERVLVSVMHPKAEEAPAAGAVAAETPEGEPEVIKKGKPDEA